MAGDPLQAVVLMGLGYENLSMSASSLLRVKSVLLNVSHKQAQDLVRRALRMPDAGSIARFMADALNQPEVARLIRLTSQSYAGDSSNSKT